MPASGTTSGGGGGGGGGGNWPIFPRRLWLAYAQFFFGLHLFKQYFGEVALTQGPSMLPTLNPRGEWVYVNKLYRRGRGVRAGDIVTVKHPIKPEERASKRVVGMPGDYVLRDSPPSSHPSSYSSSSFPSLSSSSSSSPSNHYAHHRKQPTMIQVPEGHVWLAGDNQPWSRDSRDYGPVPMALIRGKVTALVWPPSRMGRLRNTLDPVAAG